MRLKKLYSARFAKVTTLSEQNDSLYKILQMIQEAEKQVA